MKIIFHIDMNSFFASAEVSRDPSLKGKPLVVSGRGSKGIVTTASYEARAFGVHAAMPNFMALKLCRNLIIKPIDFTLYHEMSNRFFNIVASYSELIEVASIDECYVDVSELCKNIEPYQLALDIQHHILEELSIGVSIGIAPNKFLAKMASDIKKPLGITILGKDSVKKVLWPLSIEKMYGIGRKTVPKLKALMINTIGDLANYDDRTALKNILGNSYLSHLAHSFGKGTNKINTKRNELQSVGNSTTLKASTMDEAIILDYLLKLSLQVSKRAKNRNLVGNNISITIREASFKTIVRSITLPYYTHDSEIIYQQAVLLFHNNYTSGFIRLVGVSLNHVILKENYIKQLTLFDYHKDVEETKISRLMHSVNELNKKKILIPASDLNQKAPIQKKFMKEDHMKDR